MINARTPTFGDRELAEPGNLVDERRWGYILNAPGMTIAQLNIWQRLSVLVATYLLSFSLACLVPMFLGMMPHFDILCVAASVLMTLLAMPFAWYATRGSKAYIYVNTYQNELREVVPNMIGKPTVLRRIPFSEIGGVRVDHGGEGQRAVLLLWQGGSWRRVAVLEGGRGDLTSLREKLAKDVFGEELQQIMASAANAGDLPAAYRTESVQNCRIA